MYQPTVYDGVAVVLGLLFSWVQDRYERRHRSGRKPKPKTIIAKNIGWVIFAVVAERLVFEFLV